MAYERKCVGKMNPLRIWLSLYLLVSVALHASLCSAAESLVFDLTWQSTGAGHFIRSEEDVQPPFAKEPDFEGRQVVRGLAPCAERQADCMAYIWDAEKQRLYLDINNNRDLTDDPAGVIQSHRQGKRSQNFQKEISCIRGSLSHKYCIKAHLDQWTPSRVLQVFTVTSGYSGQIEIGGEKWHIEVVEFLNGKSDREDRFHIFPCLPDQDYTFGSGMPLPKGLFIDGCFHHCNYELAADANQPNKMRLSLTPGEAPQPLRTEFSVGYSTCRCKPRHLCTRFKILGQDGDHYLVFGHTPLPQFTIFKRGREAYTGTLALDRIDDYRHTDEFDMSLFLSGKIEVVASYDLGSSGRLESEPVPFDWRQWESPVSPPIMIDWGQSESWVSPRIWWLWLPLVLVIVVIRSNWSLQVLWLGVPLALFMPGLSLLDNVTDISADMANALEFIVWPLVIGLAVVLLLGDKLGRCRKFKRLVFVVLILIGVWALHGFLRVFPLYGDMLVLTPVMGGTALMIPALATLCCRRHYTKLRFLAWLTLWTVVCSILAMASCLLPHLFVGVNLFVQLVPYSLTVTGIFFLILIPLALLGMLNRFYRVRFFGLLGMKNMPVKTQDIQANPANAEAGNTAAEDKPA